MMTELAAPSSFALPVNPPTADFGGMLELAPWKETIPYLSSRHLIFSIRFSTTRQHVYFSRMINYIFIFFGQEQKNIAT